MLKQRNNANLFSAHQLNDIKCKPSPLPPPLLQGGNLKTEAELVAAAESYDDDEDQVKWTTLVRRDEDKTPFGTHCLFRVENDAAKSTPFRFVRIYIEKTRNAGNFPLLHRVFIGGT